MFLFLEEIRTKLTSRFLEFEDYFIVDSLPLEICKFARHRRIKICKNEFETAPRKRIETLFSQLCDQFRIINNYAKIFEGFKTRILAK